MSLGSPRGDGSDTLAVPPALPELGKVRCYWALMDSAMNYRYLDPVLAYHMKDVSALHSLIAALRPIRLSDHVVGLSKQAADSERSFTARRSRNVQRGNREYGGIRRDGET